MNNIIFNQEKLNQIIYELSVIEKFPININYEIPKQVKTKKQLGYIWGGLLVDLERYFNEEGQAINEGYKTCKWTTDDVKIYLYHKIIGTQYKELPNGEIITYQKTISQMTKQELSEFINKCIDFIENETECILRPELRNCWLLHIDDNYYTLLDNYKFPVIDKDYVRHQTKQTCLYCGSGENIVYHHIRKGGSGGTSQKPPDWFTIPLCHVHHTELHNGKDILSGLAIYGFDLEVYCRLNYLKWILKL